jgi:hypothetical protein
MIRMLIVGCVFAFRWERKICAEASGAMGMATEHRRNQPLKAGEFCNTFPSAAEDRRVRTQVGERPIYDSAALAHGLLLANSEQTPHFRIDRGRYATRLDLLNVYPLSPRRCVLEMFSMGVNNMTRPLIACAVVCLTAVAASAADPKVDSAIGVFKQVEGDPDKLNIFCEMSDVTDAQGDTEDAAADAKIDGYLQQLGPEFETAWDTSEEVDENSPDGKLLDAALDALGDKCPE